MIIKVGVTDLRKKKKLKGKKNHRRSEGCYKDYCKRLTFQPLQYQRRRRREGAGNSSVTNLPFSMIPVNTYPNESSFRVYLAELKYSSLFLNSLAENTLRTTLKKRTRKSGQENCSEELRALSSQVRRSRPKQSTGTRGQSDTA